MYCPLTGAGEWAGTPKHSNYKAIVKNRQVEHHLVLLKDESGTGTLSNTDTLIQETNKSSHSVQEATLHLISVMAKGEGAEQFPTSLLLSAKPVTQDDIKIAKVGQPEC